MRKIFITDKQFQYIVKKLSKQYKYFNIPSEELGLFCNWLDSDITGFPFKIGLVDGCIEDKEVFPYVYFIDKYECVGKITVSYVPQYVGNITLSGDDDKLLKQFIINNVEALYYNSHTFCKKLSTLNFEKKLPEILEESPTIRPEITGLNTPLWIDQAQTYKKGGHWQRIKFQDGPSTKTKDFATMTIGDIPIVIKDTFKGNVDGKELKRIKEFVKLNKQLLMDLGLGNINFYNDFIPNIYTFRGKDIIFHGYKNNRNFNLTDSQWYNFVVIKSNDGLYNYFDNTNGGILCPYWFDYVMPINKYGKELTGRGEINGYIFDVYLDGTLKCVGR